MNTNNQEIIETKTTRKLKPNIRRRKRGRNLDDIWNKVDFSEVKNESKKK